MARTLTTQDVSWFLDLNEKGQLNLNPPYQRRSVWSPRDKRFFVDTILNNYPAPPVFLHKSLNDLGKATYHVVDGKQRLQTIIDFTENKVKIPDDFSDVNLQGKRWKNLERESREKVWNYVLIVEMLPDIGDAAIRNIFERINRNSRKLMPQELRHAKYDGWLVTVVEAEAEKQEWKDFGVVTPARMKRMADAQFISELMAVQIDHGIRGFDQDMLDDLYAKYEDLEEHPDLVEDDFNAAVSAAKLYLTQMLAAEPDVVTYFKIQTHFYTLWAYVILNSQHLLPPADFAPTYKSFLDKASAMQDPAFPGPGEAPSALDRAAFAYAQNSRGASTELPQRQARQDAFMLAFHGQEVAAGENS